MPKSENKNDGDTYKAECVVKLRRLLTETSKLKNIQVDDSTLELFLSGTVFDVDTAFQKVRSYYEVILEYPEWFPAEGPLEKKWVIDKDIRICLPEHDKEGRIIYIAKIGNIDMDNMKIFDVVAVDDIFIESLLASNPQVTEKGLCVIVDVANYSWKMLKWVTPENIKLSVKKMLSLPFKDFRFHLVNKSMVIHVAIKIMWPLIPASVKEMLKFHFDDWDSLYKHIDQAVLPPEYGGSNNISYKEIYKNLFDRDEEIVALLKVQREAVSKCNR